MPGGELLIILANQPRQPGVRGIDQGMDAVLVGVGGRPIKVGLQQRLVEGRRGHVRRPPGGEHGQGTLDQPLVVRGREAGAARAMIALKEVGARKAGLELLRQPHADALDLVWVTQRRGQPDEGIRRIAVEEAAQRHRPHDRPCGRWSTRPGT